MLTFHMVPQIYMKKLLSIKFFLIIVFSVFSHVVLTQSENKHQLAIQASPFCYFYDGVSPFNSRDALLNGASIPFIFRGRIRGSLGFYYAYKLNKDFLLRIGYTSFNATGYSKNTLQEEQWNLGSRYHKILNLEVNRTYNLNNRFSLLFGVGAICRYQRSILLWGSNKGHNVQFTDFGFSANIGTQYLISENWFFSCTIDISWFSFLGGAKQRAELEQLGGPVAHFFPRYSSTIKFGIGFSF